MRVSNLEPVRWMSGTGSSDLVVDHVLYRRESWITTFLACLGEHLVNSFLEHVHLDVRRSAVVATGQTESGALRVVEASYLDVLLFHPRLHPDVEALLARAIEEAVAECDRQRFVHGDALRRLGRRALLDNPALLLEDTVVDGVRRLGLAGLPPFGVTGLVDVHWDGRVFVLAVLRSQRVAVNPGCLAPPVDGGITRDGGIVNPAADLERELKDELPWAFDGPPWEPLGLLLPQGPDTFVAGRRTLRCGANVVFRRAITQDPEELLRRAVHHFELTDLVLIETTDHRDPDRLPAMLVLRHGAVVELPSPPELSEVLAASLHASGVVQLRPTGDVPNDTPEPPVELRTSEAPMSSSPPAPAMELSLEDAWADQLMARFPRLRRVLDTQHVLDLRENRIVPTRDDIGPISPILDAVREYELVCRSNQLELVDEARLFEAVVIRISRNLFANDEVLALASYEFLETMEAVGDRYQERLDVTITADADEAHKIAEARRAARTTAPAAPAPPARAEGAEGDVITLDDSGPGTEIVDISKAVATRLRELNTEEAAVAYSEVKRRSQLLCFCAALWSVEAKRSTKAADVALDERFRRMLSGDAVALFFRSRALLVSPVASTAQTQLGLQFVTTALSFFPRNPGMHHTRALFLLRKSSTIVGEQESFDCLAQALESVEEALKWDAEFPIFYATRAKVKYRQHNRSGALVDLRAAIELARYGVSSRAARADIATWESLLESWDLAPVGVASGAG